MQRQPVSVYILIATFAVLTTSSALGQGQAVSPAASPASVTTIADTDPGWIWDHMVSCDTSGAAASSAHAGGPGTSATFIFSGTGVTIYGISASVVHVNGCGHRIGKVDVTVDGKSEGVFPEYTPGQAANSAVCVIHNLQDGNHSLIIEATDEWVAVSSITIDHTAPPVPAAKSIPAGVYKICPRNAAPFCLDVLNNSTADGSIVAAHAPDSGANQQFQLTHTSKDSYLLQPLSVASDALSVLPNASDNSLFLGIWPNMENPAQEWKISVAPSGYYRLSPSNTPTFALTVGDHSPTDSLTYLVSISSYTGATNQDWELIPRSGG